MGLSKLADNDQHFNIGGAGSWGFEKSLKKLNGIQSGAPLHSTRKWGTIRRESTNNGGMTMTKINIYLVRHGQTYYNIYNKLQGWSNSPLTDQGYQDAEKAGQRLKDVHFDAAFVPTLPAPLKPPKQSSMKIRPIRSRSRRRHRISARSSTALTKGPIWTKLGITPGLPTG